MYISTKSVSLLYTLGDVTSFQYLAELARISTFGNVVISD